MSTREWSDEEIRRRPPPRRPRRHIHNLLPRNPFRRRHRHVQRGRHPTPPSPKPIYIYPGLLRIVREGAIALDNQCPAVLYKCRDCPSPSSHSSQSDSSDFTDRFCHHQFSCSICLDDFHGKDLVRKLPCNVNHVFHSKCILDWFATNQRCPLCNEPVTQPLIQPPPPPTPLFDHPPHIYQPSEQSQFASHISPSDIRRARSFRSLPVVTLEEHDYSSQRLWQRRVSELPTSDRSPLFDQLDISDASSQTQSTADRNCQSSQEKDCQPLSDTNRKRRRGPRTYSYIVHDSVRMDLMTRVIPR